MAAQAAMTNQRGFGPRMRIRYLACALGALVCLLLLATSHRARSQNAKDAPPAPLGSQRIELVDNGVQWTVPACLSHTLDQRDPRITRVVVGIQGLDRVVNAAFGALMEARREAPGANADSLVVAPQFVTLAERDRYRLDSAIPCWEASRWIQGDDSLVSRHRSTVSSFRIMDLLLERLADHQVYPNLKTIVVVGHSAGGQFVQRYAAGSTIADRLSRRAIDIRWVVANPGSYLYLTGERPIPGQPEHFALPSPATRRRVSFFDNYKYGLNRLNPYMQARGSGLIQQSYAARRITYLLGERDNDPNHPQLDRGKAALLEGPSRLERGLAFYRYLRHLYGPEISRTQSLVIVPGAGHSARRMFTSPAGIRTLFTGESPTAVAAR